MTAPESASSFDWSFLPVAIPCLIVLFYCSELLVENKAFQLKCFPVYNIFVSLILKTGKFPSSMEWFPLGKNKKKKKVG